MNLTVSVACSLIVTDVLHWYCVNTVVFDIQRTVHLDIFL